MQLSPRKGMPYVVCGLILAATISTTVQTEAQSFDCSKAKTASARLICSDGDLARLDSQLGAAFQKRKVQLPTIEQQKFAAEQVTWIKERNSRCGLVGKDSAAIEILAASKPCMVSAIQERIALLTQTGQSQTTVLSTPHRQITARSPVHPESANDELKMFSGSDLSDLFEQSSKPECRERKGCTVKTEVGNKFSLSPLRTNNSRVLFEVVQSEANGSMTCGSGGCPTAVLELKNRRFFVLKEEGLGYFTDVAMEELGVVAQPMALITDPLLLKYPTALAQTHPAALVAFQKIIPTRFNKVVWIYQLIGASSPMIPLTIQGRQYLSGSVCKPHDCVGNVVAFVIAADGSRAVASLMLENTTQMLGNPNEGEVAILNRYINNQVVNLLTPNALAKERATLEQLASDPTSQVANDSPPQPVLKTNPSALERTVRERPTQDRGVLAQNRWPDAYSRRNYQLGMTLTAFKNAPYPDQKEWPSAFPVCSNEPQPSDSFSFDAPTLSDDWRKIGAIKCVFAYRSDLFGHPQVTAAGLMLGNVSPTNEFYFFQPEGSTEPVLYYIDTEGPSSAFDETAAAFREALGLPTQVRNFQVQNGIGNVFSNTEITYKRGQSVIKMTRFTETLQIFSVVYDLVPVTQAFLDKLEKVTGRASDRL